MKLRQLTQKGMKKLEADLEKHRQENSIDPIIDINRYESQEVNGIEVDKSKQFDNKLSVGKYFLHIFPDKFQPDIKIWNWLSVLYYRQLLNIQKKIGELQRLFISEYYSYYPYRHLLKVPYDICKFYKEDLDRVKFLLLDKVNRSGVLYRRIAENQDIKKNQIFMEIASRVFYDRNRKSIRQGIDITDAITRLIQVWKQYERSFDMYRMPSKEVIEKLLSRHDEFGQFIKESSFK